MTSGRDIPDPHGGPGSGSNRLPSGLRSMAHTGSLCSKIAVHGFWFTCQTRVPVASLTANSLPSGLNRDAD